ncbi:MAG: YceI family protein [Kiritimatiellae bacterium]|nr:YceI family protein [Kiritimatiellia bacterium]
MASFAASATIPVAGIDTRNKDRDDHLRSPDFFDAEKYPEIKFNVTRVDVNGGDPVLYGDLTMKGITKEIQLPVFVSGPVKDMAGNMRAGFEGATRINRQDWGVSWSKTLDGGGLVVDDFVRITVNIEGVKAEGSADEAIAAEDAAEAAQE